MMSAKQSVEWELAGETEVLGENLPQWHFVHHNPHDLTWARTRAAAVGSRRLTAWAMARPLHLANTNQAYSRRPAIRIDTITKFYQNPFSSSGVTTFSWFMMWNRLRVWVLYCHIKVSFDDNLSTVEFTECVAEWLWRNGINVRGNGRGLFYDTCLRNPVCQRTCRFWIETARILSQKKITVRRCGQRILRHLAGKVRRNGRQDTRTRALPVCVPFLSARLSWRWSREGGKHEDKSRTSASFLSNLAKVSLYLFDMSPSPSTHKQHLGEWLKHASNSVWRRGRIPPP
jgi:hypothetical protein